MNFTFSFCFPRNMKKIDFRFDLQLQIIFCHFVHLYVLETYKINIFSEFNYSTPAIFAINFKDICNFLWITEFIVTNYSNLK